LISIDGSLKDTLGVKNPYRYRGYRYDNETGLYYLQSRYYNPETCRMLNADGLVGTPGEILSANMFAYCGNNHVNREDPSGCLWGFIKEFVSQVSSAINTLKPAYAVAGGCALGDGPLLIGDLIGAAIAGVVTIGAVGYAAYKTKTASRESTKSTTIATETSQKKREQPTVIYRYGSGSNTNLTPRPQDTGGLSFSLTPPASGKYVVTTIQAVNATGILRAVKDGTNHVSVMPTNPLTMSGWIASRPNAQTSPHPYTVTLKSIVWDSK
ncbi:MAG: RHS repeat-associated core domain-containing protein, partial [Clostridiaceae bacterium]